MCAYKFGCDPMVIFPIEEISQEPMGECYKNSKLELRVLGVPNYDILGQPFIGATKGSRKA
jgi:hypothetical protein